MATTRRFSPNRSMILSNRLLIFLVDSTSVKVLLGKITRSTQRTCRDLPRSYMPTISLEISEHDWKRLMSMQATHFHRAEVAPTDQCRYVLQIKIILCSAISFGSVQQSNEQTPCLLPRLFTQLRGTPPNGGFHFPLRNAEQQFWTRADTFLLTKFDVYILRWTDSLHT